MLVPDFGGHPAIDFANSVITWRGETHDTLASLAGVRDWLVELGLLSPETPDFKSIHAGAEPFLQRIQGLRGLTRQILASMRDGRSLPSAAVPELNRWLGQRRGALRILTGSSGDYRLAFEREPQDPGDLAPVVAELIAGLITQPGIGSRVRQCANPECGAFFLAGTRGQPRRWCSMERCGNRMKARTYHERQRRTSD